MRSETIRVHTGSSEGVRDITRECAGFVSSYDDGLLHVFVPHTDRRGSRSWRPVPAPTTTS